MQYVTQQAEKPLNINAKSIFLWPSILGCIMFVGLIAALLDDGGILEMIALFLLAIPTVFMVYVYGLKRHFSQKD